MTFNDDSCRRISKVAIDSTRTDQYDDNPRDERGALTMVLLIGGHVRSGTSMIRELCNQHPDMTITHELGNFMAVGKPYDVYRRVMLKRWKESNVLRYRIFRSDRNNTRLRRWIRSMRGHLFTYRFLKALHTYGSGPVRFENVQSALLNFFPHSRIVGDKWPDYVTCLDQIVPWIDRHNARCVIIYRDCRDVASSTLFHVRSAWKNQPWTRDADTSEKVAQRWLRAIENMELYQENIHTIQYENLVRDPKSVINNLAEYLGVDPSGFPIQMIRDANIGKYKKGLTPDELATVERIAGPTMARLGYELELTHI